MINGRNLFDQTRVSYITAYDNIRKIALGQKEDYTTGCLLHYTYFFKKHKFITIDLYKQKVVDANPKAMQ